MGFLVPLLLILVGFFLFLSVVLKKFAHLGRLSDEEAAVLSNQPLTPPKIVSALNPKHLAGSKRFLSFLEITLRSFQRPLALSLKLIERRMAHTQMRLQKLAGESPASSIPYFFATLRRRKAFVEEEKKLLELVTKNPDDVDSWWRLARLYLHDKRDKEARSTLREILRINPDDQEAKTSLGGFTS